MICVKSCLTKYLLVTNLWTARVYHQFQKMYQRQHVHIVIIQKGVEKMVNRGKDFEEVVKKCFENVPDTTVIRLPDPTNGYLGVRNICDFLVYQYPHIMFIECKSVHGNTMPFSNITDNQWNGMLKQAETKGTICGVICWWVDKDVTKFLPITEFMTY